MIDLSRNGYSHQEIMNILHAVGGSRVIRFRYDLLDKEENKIVELDNIESAEVSMNSFNTIKLTASFRMKEFNYERSQYSTWKEIGYYDWSDL